MDKNKCPKMKKAKELVQKKSFVTIIENYALVTEKIFLKT